MSSSPFTKEQEMQIIAAITKAEEGNRGEVRVHIEKNCPFPQALDQAETLFFQLGMQHTQDATGVLLYIATKSRKAAIFADQGVYPSRDQSFWQDVIDSLGSSFAAGKPVHGLVVALGTIGDLLRELVPGEDLAGNELPNEVSYDE